MITAIQHVPTPERVNNVRRLKDDLDGWAESVTVITDIERRGPQWSWREALRSAEGSRLLTLQDDVEITAPLQVIDTLAALRPDDILCLCYPRKSAVDIAAKGFRWVSLRGMWVYGVVYPPGLAKEIVTWADKHVPLEYKHDDRTLSAYMNHHAMFAYGPIPSVVQHLTYTSTMGHGNLPHKREAHVTWHPSVNYSDLRAYPHSSHRWTVAEIKQTLGLLP